MKKTAIALMVCASILTPAVARADDGGFWDMLFHWDTKFSGFGTEFHIACYTEKHQRVENCEEWFTKLRHFFNQDKIEHQFTAYEGTEGKPVRFNQIRHEVNFRVSYMHSYGQRIPDDKLAPDDPIKNDTRKVHAVKLLGLYNYRTHGWDVGGGGGTVPLFGDDVQTVWRGVVTAGAAHSIGGAWYGRVDLSYYTNTITGADFGHPTSSLVIGPGPNLSATIGFDLRRAGTVKAAPSR